MTCGFDGVVEGTDDVLVRGEFAVLVDPSVKILSQRLAGDGHIVAVNHVVPEQEVKNFCVELGSGRPSSSSSERERTRDGETERS